MPLSAAIASRETIAGLLDSGAIEMAKAQLQIEHYWAGALASRG